MRTYQIKWILVMMVGLFSACYPQEEPEENTNLLTIQSALPETVPANDTNAYDEVGRLHNELLDLLFNSSYYADSLLSEKEICKGIKEYALDRWEHVVREKALTASIQRVTTGIADRYEQQLVDSPYSATAKDYFRSLRTLIENGLLTRKDYLLMKEEIMSLEIQIQTNALLSFNDKKMLLIAGSIARYSLYYWTNQGTGILLDKEAAHMGPQARLTFKSVVRCIATVTSDAGTGFMALLGDGLYDAVVDGAAASAYAYTYVTYGMPGPV